MFAVAAADAQLGTPITTSCAIAAVLNNIVIAVAIGSVTLIISNSVWFFWSGFQSLIFFGFFR
jgi:hypothetical protein